MSHLASEISHVYFAALSHLCHASLQLPNISVPAIKQYGQMVGTGQFKGSGDGGKTIQM